jgi:hypothetical protein
MSSLATDTGLATVLACISRAADLVVQPDAVGAIRHPTMGAIATTLVHRPGPAVHRPRVGLMQINGPVNPTHLPGCSDSIRSVRIGPGGYPDISGRLPRRRDHVAQPTDVLGGLCAGNTESGTSLALMTEDTKSRRPDTATSRARERRSDIFRKRSRVWLAAGCSPRAAAALANAQVDKTEQIGHLGRDFFRRQPNCGPRTLAEIGTLIGGWPEQLDKSAREAIAEALMRSVADFRQALEMAEEAISALHRGGFIISSRTASRMVPVAASACDACKMDVDA